MKVKVQCPCETRFEFEVTPVNGRMPVSINCPTCGADATELANAIIQQQSAAAPAGLVLPPRVNPPVAANPPAPTSAPAASLRVAKIHSAPAPAAQDAPPDSASAETEPAAQPCARHKSEAAVEVCHVCGKPICLKCMEQFGYVCSVYCRQQANLKQIDVPVYAHQKSVVAGKSNVLAKRLTYAVTALVVLLLGFWFWYAWFARNYKIVYTVQLPKRNPDSDKPYKPDAFYQLVGPGQLLTVTNKQITMFDVAQQKQLWSTPLQSEAEAAAIQAARAKNEEIIKRTPKVRSEHGFDMTHYVGLDPLGDEDEYYFAKPGVIATTNDIWISFPDRLARFDRQTGTRKEVAIKDKILNITLGDDAILVLSGIPGANEFLTQITLPDGNLQTEELTAPPKAEPPAPTNAADKSKATKGKTAKPAVAVNKVPVGQIKTLATQPNPPTEPDDEPMPAYFGEELRPFIAAGPNVVQFKTKLLEHKTISHVAMKAKGPSVLDSGNVTASQGLDLAQEMMNDSRREMTGGVDEEDVSRYEVTLHRRFAKDVPDWTGEVTGPPQFFPLKTVDVVAAGESFYVLDKQNKKLWEAKLAFSVASRFSGEHSPCLETRDALYFADLGILARYDLATGNVRWRYNSVGISRIQADERGGIYLDTTSADADSIKYSQQINVHNKIHPIIMKLDPGTGKVVWRLESIGDHCVLSGKFLYSTWVTTSAAALHLEEGPDTHYYLDLLDPGNGSEIWSFHRGNRSIIKTEVQKNWILLHFRDELLVMKFFSL